MRRWTLAPAAVAAALCATLLAGCGGAADQSAPTPSGAASATDQPSAGGGATAVPSAPATPSSPASGSGSSAGGPPCPSGQPAGTYKLEQFAGQGTSVMGSGKGGDVAVTFTDGRYRMTGKGGQPMTITLQNGSSGELLVDGTIDGTYGTSGSTRRFTVGSSKGSARLSSGAQQATLPFDQVAAVIGMDGEFAVACSGDRLAIAGTRAVFSLAKV